jgi:tetratricopeptide (TPR) repeat protein
MSISFRYVLTISLAWTLGALTVQGQSTRVTPAESPAPSSPVARAQSLLNAGQVDAAVETLTAASRLKPNDAQVQRLLGLAYYRKGDYKRAVEYLSVAVRQTPEGSRRYREVVQALGLSHYMLGHVGEAVPYLERLNRWSPDNREIAYALGVGFIQTRRPDKARETFARLFGVPPGAAAAYLINAQMMVRQQLEGPAETELRKALELDPRLPQAHFLLGEMAIYHARIDLGIELLQKEIALNPAFGMAHYRLGEAYTRQLKWDEAMGPLQKSIWLNPFFSGPYIVLGKVYLKKGDLANAENVLGHAVRMDPNNFSAHHLLAQVLQRAGRVEEAKREFGAAEKLRVGTDREP